MTENSRKEKRKNQTTIQFESELTLARATQIARQSELVKEQMERRDLSHSFDAVKGGDSGHLQSNGRARGGTDSRRVHGRPGIAERGAKYRRQK